MFFAQKLLWTKACHSGERRYMYVLYASMPQISYSWKERMNFLSGFTHLFQYLESNGTVVVLQRGNVIVSDSQLSSCIDLVTGESIEHVQKKHILYYASYSTELEKHN